MTKTTQETIDNAMTEEAEAANRPVPDKNGSYELIMAAYGFL